jgi:hypothetical protein
MKSNEPTSISKRRLGTLVIGFFGAEPGSAPLGGRSLTTSPPLPRKKFKGFKERSLMLYTCTKQSYHCCDDWADTL